MKSENVIFEALAIDNNAATSSSLGEVGKNTSVAEIYIKNAIISLVSLKKHNQDSTVGLVINIELDDKWKRQLTENGIEIWMCPFDTFVMPKHFVYSLSYYKLCAFDFILKNTDYKRICFIDCDTFGVKNFADIWTEVDNAFLIIPNESSHHAKTRTEINTLHELLTGQKNKTITHFSSGFIAGTRSEVTKVIDLCEEVYKKLVTFEEYKPKGGDEIVWSPALSKYNGRIHSPKCYCLLSFISASNYWMDKERWDDPDVIMWHLPGDKRYSLIWAYDYFDKKGVIPPVDKMASASRFRHVRPHFTWLPLRAILKDTSSISRNIKKLFQKAQ